MKPSIATRLIVILAALLQGCQSVPNVPINETVSQAPGDALHLGFGSCNNHRKDQDYWDNIDRHFSAKAGPGYPDFWVWAGDMVYADTTSRTKLGKAYAKVAGGSYGTFAQRCREAGCVVVGTYDDHDWGGNNLGGRASTDPEWISALNKLSRPSRKAAAVGFLGEPTRLATALRRPLYAHYDVTQSDVTTRISLLDLRYDREEPGADAELMSQEQWRWLEDNLQADGIDLHLIVSSTQVLRLDPRKDTWAQYPEERVRLLSAIAESDAPVILLSGDIHAAEISRLGAQEERDAGITFPLYEITASGLNRLRCFLSICDYGWENRYREGFEARMNFGEIMVRRTEENGLLVDAMLRSTETPEADIMLSKRILFPNS